MAYPNFPTLAAGPDSSQYGVTYEDPAHRVEVEGGYTLTRKRHTRRPRRTWTSGYKAMKPADKLLLENFWDQMGGGSVIFSWINPQDGVTYAVRFKEPLAFSYVGVGPTQLWDCRVVVEQA